MMAETFAAIALVVVFLVLFAASISDWKKREVSDIFWIPLLLIGILSLFVYDDVSLLVGVVMATSMILMTLDMCWDRDSSVKMDILLYIFLLLSVLISLYATWGSDACWRYLAIPIIYLVMNLFYYTGIVRGGADAKCIVFIAMAMQYYPSIGTFPLIESSSKIIVQIFPFAMAVFIISAVLAILIVIPMALYNISRGNKEIPNIFAGYKTNIDKISGKYVWPLEDVIDGEIVYSRTPYEQDAFERLKEVDQDSVWVTPMIPFIIPITIAFLIVLIIGNPFFIL